MTNKKSFLIVLVVLAIVLWGATALYRSLSKAAPAAESESAAAPGEDPAAPDFQMLDRDGNSVAFADSFGKPVVLNFWASWCSPCKSEMPVFDAVAKELSGKVDFVMVNLTDGGRETVDTASAFIAEQGYTFPVFYDTLSEGAAAYAVRTIPATYFIGADGTVKAYARGALSEESLRKGIEMISE